MITKAIAKTGRNMETTDIATAVPVSKVETGTAVAMSVVSIFLPVLAIALVIIILFIIFRLYKKFKTSKS